MTQMSCHFVICTMEWNLVFPEDSLYCGIDTQGGLVFSKEVSALLPFVAPLKENHVYPLFFLFLLNLFSVSL